MRALGDYLQVKCHACVGGTSVREDTRILQARRCRLCQTSAAIDVQTWTGLMKQNLDACRVPCTAPGLWGPHRANPCQPAHLLNCRAAYRPSHPQGGVHVVVGTPGRVYDMLRRRALRADNIKMFVLVSLGSGCTAAALGSLVEAACPVVCLAVQCPRAAARKRRRCCSTKRHGRASPLHL